jgi:hypothetical protein
MEADNPQSKLDKAMEAAAHKLNLCQVDGHWSTKVSGWLMPHNGCGCCLAWRGLFIGFLAGTCFALAALYAISKL